jgi:hypothetical protein
MNNNVCATHESYAPDSRRTSCCQIPAKLKLEASQGGAEWMAGRANLCVSVSVPPNPGAFCPTAFLEGFPKGPRASMGGTLLIAGKFPTRRLLA